MEFMPAFMLAAWEQRSVLAWRSLLIKNSPKSVNVFGFFSWWNLKGRSGLCWISALLSVIVVVFDPEAVKKNFLYHWAGLFLCAVWFPGMLLAWKQSPAEPLTQDTAGRRNQIPGQDGYLRTSIANCHPWKSEPNSLSARISASLCNPTSHNVEWARREKGKLLQTQRARNAKRNTISGQTKVPKPGLAHKGSKGWLLLECFAESLSVMPH